MKTFKCPRNINGVTRVLIIRAISARAAAKLADEAAAAHRKAAA